MLGLGGGSSGVGRKKALGLGGEIWDLGMLWGLEVEAVGLEGESTRVGRKEALGLGRQLWGWGCSGIGRGSSWVGRRNLLGAGSEVELWGWEEEALGGCVIDSVSQHVGVYLSLQTDLHTFPMVTR